MNYPILVPERIEGEPNYKERRRVAHEYIASVLQGTIRWNPAMQGTYFDRDRVRHPETGKRHLGKGLRRKMKEARRDLRVKAAQLELDAQKAEVPEVETAE